MDKHQKSDRYNPRMVMSPHSTRYHDHIGLLRELAARKLVSAQITSPKVIP